MKLLVALLLTFNAFAGTLIINPHFGHSLSATLNSSLFNNEDKTVRGLTAGLRVMYRSGIFFFGGDYEQSNFKIDDNNLDDGYSSYKVSGISGLKLNDNEVYAKLVPFGVAEVSNLGEFQSVLGYELGYNYRINVKNVTKLILTANYSYLKWDDFNNNGSNENDLEITRVHLGVSIPFEIDL